NAKILCSCIFVSGMTQSQAEAEDLGFSLLWLSKNVVDAENRTVRSSVLGVQAKSAVYRDGFGCTLYNGKPDAYELKSSATEFGPELWPDVKVNGSPELREVLASAFDTSNAQNWNTRAVLVLKNGFPAGEMYAEGFDHTTPLL